MSKIVLALCIPLALFCSACLGDITRAHVATPEWKM